MNRLFIFFPAVLLMFSSCNKDGGCNQKASFNYDPDGSSTENCVWQPVDFEVSFKPVYGEIELVLGDTITTADNRKLTVDYFGMYFTEFALNFNGANISFKNINEDCVAVTSDALLFNDENRTFRSRILPSAGATLDSIMFNVGVDSCRNNGLDPSTQASGPFAPQVPTMYWGWASGYRFVSIDGMVDASANADGSDIKQFEFHTGLNSLLRSVTLNLGAKEIVTDGVSLELKVDFEKLLEGVDFTAEWSTHTFDNRPLAEEITENATLSISLDE